MESKALALDGPGETRGQNRFFEKIGFILPGSLGPLNGNLNKINLQIQPFQG
jgi:hypothetical protein